MLRIEHVSKTYPNGVQALADVDLEFGAGEIIAIVGGSGCGKSTLLRVAAGLDTATRGGIHVDGVPITRPHPDVGIVFQEHRLLPWLSIRDNVAFYLGDLPRVERDARVSRALERIGLSGYGDRWPRELSGGQAQRVSIARSLVAQPKVLLLDEPFSALDAFTRISLQQSLLQLWTAYQPTLVIVTHDVQEAVLLGGRVIVMASHPGTVAREIAVSLPYPRDRLSDAFSAVEREVMRALDGAIASSGRQVEADAAW